MPNQMSHTGQGVFFSHIIIKENAKFELDVNENKDVIFLITSSSTLWMLSEDLLGVCGPQLGTLGKDSDFCWGLSCFSET